MITINQKIKSFCILCLLVLSISCNKENDLAKLKAERNNLNTQVTELNAKLKEINTKIELLEPTQKSTLVSTRKLQYEVFEHYIDLQSNIKTDKDVTIYPEFQGVMRLLVREGQYVSAGQTIAIINDGGLRDQSKQAQMQVNSTTSQMQSAEAQASLARTAFQKQSKLWAQKIGSEMQYLTAKTNYEAAQKQLAAMRSQVAATQKGVSIVNAQISRTAVRAPFSGLIDQIITQDGQVVAPGVPIARIINGSAMKVEANVPEKYISNVKTGTSVKIEIPNLGEKIDSRIARVGGGINPSNRTFIVEIPVPNKSGMVKPNLLAKIKIIDYLNPNAIVVPSNCIKEDDEGNNYVFILSQSNGNSDIAKKIMITKGNTTGNETEVKSGLKINDIVITEGINSISDGSKIKM